MTALTDDTTHILTIASRTVMAAATAVMIANIEL